MVVTGPLVGAAVASPARTPVQPVRLSSAFRQAQHPALATDGHGDVALVARGAGSHVLVSYRRAGHAWQRTRNLSGRREHNGAPRVAMGSNGFTAVAWHHRKALLVRTRRDNGSWTAAHAIHVGRYDELVGLAVNRHHKVAVEYMDDGNATFHVVVHIPHHRWRVTSPAGYAVQLQIGLDDHGVVHGLEYEAEHGGVGRIHRTHLAPGGRWSKPRRFRAGTLMVEDTQFAVSPSGAETIGVGYVGKGWKSTFDTDLYWSTAHKVYRQARPGAPLRKVWDRNGARTLRFARAGRQLRLAWQQWQRPDNKGVPHRVALQTQAVGHAARTLAREPMTFDQNTDEFEGSYDFAVATGSAGAGAVLWRAWPESGRSSPLLATRVSGDRVWGPGTVSRATRARVWAGTSVGTVAFGTKRTGYAAFTSNGGTRLDALPAH